MGGVFLELNEMSEYKAFHPARKQQRPPSWTPKTRRPPVPFRNGRPQRLDELVPAILGEIQREQAERRRRHLRREGGSKLTS